MADTIPVPLILHELIKKIQGAFYYIGLTTYRKKKGGEYTVSKLVTQLRLMRQHRTGQRLNIMDNWATSRPVSAQSRASVGQFFRGHLTGIKRIQYAAIFIICATVLVFQVVKCVEKYFIKNTGTADKYVHVSKTSFPELTICPTYPYKLDVLQRNGISGRNKIQLGAQWLSNDTFMTPQKLYQRVIIPANEIIHSVLIYVEQLIDGKNTIKLLANDKVCDGQEELFEPKPYYWNGNCYGFSMPSCLATAGPLEIVFEYYDKTDIFIHHYGQFLSPNSRSRVDVDKGKFIKIAITHEVVQLLTGEEFSNCVDTFDPDVSYDGCMYSKLYDIMMDKVGCTVPWLPDKTNICTDPSKSKKAFEVYQQNRRNQEYICPKSCLFTNMYFGPPVSGINDPVRKDFAWGVFYFRRDIKTTTEYVLYTLLSMAAEIGGYVGLLLGASLVNLGRINSALLDICFGKSEENNKALKENNTLFDSQTVKTIQPSKVQSKISSNNSEDFHLPKRDNYM